ncbi:hypothetical protein C8R45DRAFT_489226 [Mycena sanguinolenta]|nr:hypothetical protein C8R45DRAFT_489226 [Mycena sanguinolenta]
MPCLLCLLEVEVTDTLATRRAPVGSNTIRAEDHVPICSAFLKSNEFPASLKFEVSDFTLVTPRTIASYITIKAPNNPIERPLFTLLARSRSGRPIPHTFVALPALPSLPAILYSLFSCFPQQCTLPIRGDSLKKSASNEKTYYKLFASGEVGVKHPPVPSGTATSIKS